jgi:monoterpene epsilon-lactone hydrolase
LGGFPPTLIQGGTREIFLSNFVRLYQALDTAGQSVTLDIYEGMSHVFQVKAPESFESVTALKKMGAFLIQHLKK